MLEQKVIYYYNGTQLENYKRIKGSSGLVVIKQINTSCNYFDIIIRFVEMFQEICTSRCIFFWSGYDQNCPKVLNLDWVISTGKTAEGDWCNKGC